MLETSGKKLHPRWGTHTLTFGGNLGYVLFVIERNTISQYILVYAKRPHACTET